ncbi:MAG TPA: hypothetical protein VKY85_24900 [Candidatus Angelobacter sp.]|nr:hypothetical protein [Candidatus Angelobacter sp.]
MSNHDSVDAMVTAYAAQAIVLAREFTAQLDYSENSLMEVETILARLSREMPASKPSDDDVSELCKVWGSYLGEVVRRRFGGEWSIETYPGKQFATLTLNVNGNKLFPSIKVHRRLTEGESDNVWSFYRMVKTKLEKPTTDAK